MPIPDYQTLMLPVLRLTAQGEARIPDMLDALADEFALTDAERRELLPSGRTRVLASRAHWARTYMARAGLLRKVSRGVFEATPEGRALIARGVSRIDNALLDGYADFAQWRQRSRARDAPRAAAPPAADAPPNPGALDTPDERVREAVEEIDATLADELLSRLMEGSPTFFERAVMNLLTAMGYGRGRDGAETLRGAPGDGGIDGVIDEDALGLDAVYVQAKRYARENPVGRPAIQQFVGSLNGEGATKGVFVTTSSFSPPARSYVEKIQQRVVLIDGPRLARLMIRRGVGVRVRETYAVNEMDENFFSCE